MTGPASIVVSARFDPEPLALLVGHGFRIVEARATARGESVLGSELGAALDDHAVALVCEHDPVGREVVDAYRALRVVVACRGTPTNVDVAACSERGVLVVATPGRNAAAVADLTLALAVCCARKVIPAHRYLVEGRWRREDPIEPYRLFRGPELEGRSFGIVGLGAVGRRVARRAAGFGMRCSYFDPYVAPDEDAPATRVELDQLLRSSDFVSLHAPATPETAGMIGARQLGLMRPSAFLLNTARASLVDEDALVRCLSAGAIAGAALDVFWDEPLDPDHPLLGAPNVLLTPHIAGASDDAVRHHSGAAAEALLAIAAGRDPEGLVNPAVWEADGDELASALSAACAPRP